MKSLLIVAHGSRRAASNEEVITLASGLEERLRDQYSTVSVGFLELAEPSIPMALQACVNQGAATITVLPYFLSAGRHVFEDLPREVNKFRREKHDVVIDVLQHVGSMPTMVDLIHQAAVNPSLYQANEAGTNAQS